MAGLPLNPRHPERVCWGCDVYCTATDLACGNGTVRTPHPIELFGGGWVDWALENGIEVEDGHHRLRVLRWAPRSERPSAPPRPTA